VDNNLSDYWRVVVAKHTGSPNDHWVSNLRILFTPQISSLTTVRVRCWQWCPITYVPTRVDIVLSFGHGSRLGAWFYFCSNLLFGIQLPPISSTCCSRHPYWMCSTLQVLRLQICTHRLWSISYQKLKITSVMTGVVRRGHERSSRCTTLCIFLALYWTTICQCSYNYGKCPQPSISRM